MTNSGDAAEQIVRMSLEGTEVALKLSGSAAKNIAAALYTIAKNADRNKTKGHQRLSAMLKSGKELKVFTISEEHLKRFSQEAKRMWNDGIFLAGNRYSKTFKFTDINYMVASQEAQKKLFLAYAALINSLDCGATTKITLNNRHLNRKNFADTVLMKLKNDYLDYYRMEYNDVIMSKATGGNGIIQEKYVTVSVCKKNIEDARAYFARVGAELTARFAALGAKVTEMDATEKLRVLHDFYRSGEEVYFRFDAQDMMRKGHDFRDYICPDSIEKHSDYLMLGGKYFSQEAAISFLGVWDIW